jgi:predicted phage tail protein
MILVVVLDLPRKVGDLSARAMSIVQAMDQNVATFPKPVPKLSVVTADVATFEDLHVATQTRTRGTVVARNEARTVVVNDLQQLRAYVQMIVSGNPTHAETTAKAALMRLRRPRDYFKYPLTIVQLITGRVRLIAKAVRGAGAYDWQMSLDGTTWTSLPPTVQASTTVTDLEPGLYHFRVRAVTRQGAQNWLPAVTFAVR